jgi:hypothetical protein
MFMRESQRSMLEGVHFKLVANTHKTGFLKWHFTLAATKMKCPMNGGRSILNKNATP